MKYDPDIGIFGLDVNVVLESPAIGSREACLEQATISAQGLKRRMQAWFKDTFGITIMEVTQWRANTVKKLVGQLGAGDVEGSAG